MLSERGNDAEKGNKIGEELPSGLHLAKANKKIKGKYVKRLEGQPKNTKRLSFWDSLVVYCSNAKIVCSIMLQHSRSCFSVITKGGANRIILP